MTEQESRHEHERRLRRLARTAATRQPPDDLETETESDAAQREDEQVDSRWMEQRTLWTDNQVRRAIERGEFDNLPGAGKPIPGLGRTHDPDWWVKRLIEREELTGVLPPALAVRKEDAQLQARLDRETTEGGVRRVVADFNHQVVEARRQLLGGPPVVTPTRDPEREVAAWRTRRDELREEQRRRHAQLLEETTARQRRGRWRWWRRRRDR